MKRALISDVHSNLEALEAVFKDIRQAGADDVYFLGDLVGYGPDPEACTDLIMDRCAAHTKGNHDYALINGPYGFNYIAAEAIHCQRETMLPKCLIMCMKKKSRWAFIDRLPNDRTEGGVLYVHGSPLDPLADYVFCKNLTPMWNEEKLSLIFDNFGELMFCGHTHHPCIIYQDLECKSPAETGYKAKLDPGRKAIVNIGSVGQPRDLDSRACYVIWDLDAGEIEWRRVAYDYETTAAKIKANGCIDTRCGDRLREGK